MNDNIDNDETTSPPDFHLNGLDHGMDEDYLEFRECEHETIRIQRRFNHMNRQLVELTSLVKTLTTEEISSTNREGNGLNVLSTVTSNRSDTFLSFFISLCNF